MLVFVKLLIIFSVSIYIMCIKLLIIFSISMYIMCIILYLFGALSCRVDILQISIINCFDATESENIDRVSRE